MTPAPASRQRVVSALAKRDLRRYFENPTGYVFVTLFIFLSAAAAFWRPRFFASNLATLDQLNDVFPYLLVLFVAALCMGVWADERKEGTSELLLTLPAPDYQIVLGKYVAVLAIYTSAVLLSLSHVGVLVWLGRPDRGLLASNYLGYWTAGAALIAVGMLASLATANATVAFVLAVLLCSIVSLPAAGMAGFSEQASRRMEPFGVPYHFADFSDGAISLSALLYFATLAGFFLYLNVVFISRRHWVNDARERWGLAAHSTVRAAALLVALIALNAMVARAGVRLDATAGQMHSLGAETRRLIGGLPPGRAVRIQAFISADVPQEYVQERASLLGTLRAVESLAGAKVEVEIHETEPFSPAARLARQRYGILPRLVSDPNSAGQEPHQVFLGVAFTAGAEEQVIPFFEHGLSAEYELVRAIRIAARTARKRIGLVDTDAKLMGGADFYTGRMHLPWAIVAELRKQYDVVSVTPADPIPEQLDALVVVLPSTLLQPELDRVFQAISRGLPALIVLDPLPSVDLRLSPSAPMAARMNPYARATDPHVQKNFGDIQTALASIGVAWPTARIVWDSYRPHPELAELPREVVFVGPGNGSAGAFSPTDATTAGLQEVVMMYPGHIEQAQGASTAFEPIVTSGPLAGTASYFQLVQPTPDGSLALNVALPHEPEKKAFTLAARLRQGSGGQAPGGQAKGGRPLNAIVIADLDFISDQAFQLRANPAASGVAVDNITLFLNAIDVLAGDDSFVPLRTRRGRHRTLERVEAQLRTFTERRAREEQQANAEAQAALKGAQGNLQKLGEEIVRRRDLDAQAKDILVRNLEATERRKFDVLAAKIEQAKNAKIQASRENMEAEVQQIRGAIRTTAVLLPPLPVFLVGLAIFAWRQRRERAGAAAVRRLKAS